MNRRGGAWIAIICILVVGVSVTKMTKKFVSSDQAEIAAFTSVMEADAAGIAGRSAAAGYIGNIADRQISQGLADNTVPENAENFKIIPETIPETDFGSAAMQGAAVPGQARAAGVESDEEEDEGAGAVSEDGEPMALGEFSGIAAESDVQEIPAEEAVSETLQASAEQISEEGMTKKSLDSGTPSVTAAGESVISEVLAETVKSPLDPANVAEKTEVSAASSPKEYTYDELLGRLEAAETQSEIYQSALNDANPGSIYIAAEQDWNLWDKELNIIYTAIRGKMSEEEAEALKREEIEWVKEKDLEADKGMLKSKNQLGQNTDYIRISAARTRERCYELIFNYEEILNRTEKPKPQEIPQ